MQVYNYDPNTGVYISQSTADACPVVPGEHLIPAHATTSAPPAAKPGKIPFFKSGSWKMLDDPRGAYYDTETGAAVEWKTFNLPPVDRFTRSPRPTEDHIFWGKSWKLDDVKKLDRLKAEALAKRAQLLAASDWTQLSDSPQFSNNDWRGYRQDLRDITAQPGYPSDIAWPKSPQ